jgi:hypothetical protein
MEEKAELLDGIALFVSLFTPFLHKIQACCGQGERFAKASQ